MCKDNEQNLEKAIHIVKDIAEAVPIYPDLVQPAAKELGKSL